MTPPPERCASGRARENYAAVPWLRRVIRTVAGVSLLVGCGEVQEVPPDDCLPGDEPLFPLEVGNWWIYRVTATTGHTFEGCKTNYVDGETNTAAGPLYTIEKSDSAPNTSWLLDTGEQLEWTEKLWKDPQFDDRYDPYMLRLDYGRDYLCAAGAEYERSHTLTTYEERNCAADWNSSDRTAVCPPDPVVNCTSRWKVLPIQICPVKVKGQDLSCYCVHRSLVKGPATCGSQGPFCFARGVGKVWEQTEKTEELLDYCVDGPTCPDAPDVSTYSECSLSADGGGTWDSGAADSGHTP